MKRFTTQTMVLFTGIFVILAQEDDKKRRELWLEWVDRAYQRALDSCEGCPKEGIKHVTLARKYKKTDGKTFIVEYRFGQMDLHKAKDEMRHYHNSYLGMHIVFVPKVGEMGQGGFEMES